MWEEGRGWCKECVKKHTSYFVFNFKGVTRLTLALAFMCVLVSEGICVYEGVCRRHCATRSQFTTIGSHRLEL